MSWKIIVCTGLLCVIASPAFAQPSLSVDLVRDGGGILQLTAGGEFQWRVSIEGDGAGSLAAELAFMLTDAGLTGATATNAADWDEDNPGTDPDGIFGDFSWLVDNVDGNPEGLQSDATADEVFAAMGSVDFDPQADSEYIIITTGRPGSGTSLTTSIEWGGAYGGSGRIAQGGANTDTYAGSASIIVRRGDATLNGVNDGFDVTPFLLGFVAGTGNWTDGDFTGEGLVNGFDTTELLLGLSDPPGPGTPPGAGAAVPEPASIVLFVLGAALSLIGRRRIG